MLKEFVKSVDVLGENGVLSGHLANFVVRTEQVAMATAVEEAIHRNEHLLVEAGTGIGKTFAYLVPALLSRKKVIVSTGTKNLQDQLFGKDIFTLIKALAVRPKVSLLKGRSNYLCLHRLDLAFETGRFHDPSTAADLHTISRWRQSTQTGDVSEIDDVSEGSAVWPWVTSTKNNCLNHECPRYQQCHLMKARRQAQQSDVVIVNHHLFFSDLLLRESENSELLPDADILIFDEAHQLPDIASRFFELRFSSRQVIELCDDVNVAAFTVAAKIQQEVADLVLAVKTSVYEARLAMGFESTRDLWSVLVNRSSVEKQLKIFHAALTALKRYLENATTQSENFKNCWEQSCALLELFECVSKNATEGYIHWFETFPKTFTLVLTPLTIAAEFQQCLARHDAVAIFTSATLTVNNDFSFYVQQLGLESVKSLQLLSSYDYERQAMLYVPRYLPMPSDAYYTETMLDAIKPLLETSEGRTFILFTSHQALAAAARYLKTTVPFPLLVQGEGSKTTLLQKFRDTHQAILLGTSSFWEGVDIRGDALACVIIDKLPFASPGDPVVRTRIDYCKKQGKDPFYHYQLPHAVITFKQGIGRLIRDSQDRGLLVVCDPRFVSRAYGEIFLKSVPAMPRTRELGAAVQFLAAC